MTQLAAKTVVILLLLTAGSHLMAKEPSFRPNWNASQQQVLTLSGQDVVLTLPGNMSEDIPQSIPKNVNIHDLDLYNEWGRYEVAKLWWDYKKRVLLLFPELLGTLELKITVFSTTALSAMPLTNDGELETLIRYMYEQAYPDASDARRIPDSYEATNLQGNRWLSYTSHGRKPSATRLCYAASLTPTHFLEVSFRTIKTHDADVENWLAAAISDRVRIMSGVTLPAAQ